MSRGIYKFITTYIYLWQFLSFDTFGAPYLTAMDDVKFIMIWKGFYGPKFTDEILIYCYWTINYTIMTLAGELG